MTETRRVVHPSGVTIRLDREPLLDRYMLTCESSGRHVAAFDAEAVDLDHLTRDLDAHLARYHPAT